MKKALSFDDVLCIPKYSEVKSRKDVSLSAKWEDLEFPSMILAANMPTVVDLQSAIEMSKYGVTPVLHREQGGLDVCQQIALFKKESPNAKIAASIGINKEEYSNISDYFSYGADFVVLDVAHANHRMVYDFVKCIFEQFPNRKFVIGNFATAPTELLKAVGNHKNFAWKIGVGSGCFVRGTRILMANGQYQNIEDVRAGDRVINKDGKPATVKKSFSTGYKNVVKHRTNSSIGYTFSTSDHQYWIGDISTNKCISSTGYKRVLDKPTKSGKSKFKWKPIGSLSSQNSVCLFPKKISFEMEKTFEVLLRKKIAGNKKENFKYKEFSLNPSYDLGYVFGMFLGDGCVSRVSNKPRRSNSVVWSLEKFQNTEASKLSSCLFSIFGKHAKLKKFKNMIKVTFSLKPFADFLDSFGKREKKHLPANLFVDNRDYLRGIFDGLIDSDGSHSGERVGFVNTSKSLIELFNIISFILGNGLPIVSKPRISVGKLTGTKVEKIKEAFTARTLKNVKNRNTENYQVVKLMEIENVSTLMETFDLEIDDETHSFIANNAIVHNSCCSTRIKTGHGIPTLSSLMWIRHEYPNLFLIADGGMKHPGDICKALAAGADMVMLGSMLAATKQSPGPTIRANDGLLYKVHAGNASYSTKYNSGRDTKYIEGVESLIRVKGDMKDVISDIFDGVQSGFSYSGATNVSEFKKNAELVEVTHFGYIEGTPHILNKS